VTVHDLVPLHEISGLRPEQVRRFRAVLDAVGDADLIVADSEFTAQDIVSRTDIERSRITVVPLGVDWRRFRPPQPGQVPPLPVPGPGPTVLSIGGAHARKNLRILPEVLRPVAGVFRDLTLIRVGEPMPSEVSDRIREVLAPGRFVELSGLSPEQVASVYRSSDVLIFPSILEGFGLPILEAMAAGTPVVCSASSSLPEVGGEAALYFDPREPEEAAGQVLRVLTDGDLRARLTRLGLARAEMFSWDHHLEKLLDLYSDAAARTPRRVA
jgi:alpha-1,3-rhamnosyl/mannosyltransferase